MPVKSKSKITVDQIKALEATFGALDTVFPLLQKAFKTKRKAIEQLANCMSAIAPAKAIGAITIPVFSNDLGKMVGKHLTQSTSKAVISKARANSDLSTLIVEMIWERIPHAERRSLTFIDR